MSHEMPEWLRELADLQSGVISRRQARSAGLSKDLIKSRVEHLRWQRLHAGVYATFTGVPERQATLWAAVLRAGPGAALSFQTAAELDGLIDKPSSLIHVTIPASRRVAPIRGVIVHLRHDADRATHPTRLPPRTRVEETVLDLASSCQDASGAIDWVTRALGRGLTKQSLLREAMDQRPKLAWRRELTSVLDPDQAGIHSALEYRYHRYVEVPHRLPKGKHQARARRNGRTIYRDVLYEEYALIVELDGRIAHPAAARWRDIQRDNAAAAIGALTLRYGYLDLTATPCLVALQVSQVLRLRGWQGTASRCSQSCPVTS